MVKDFIKKAAEDEELQGKLGEIFTETEDELEIAPKLIKLADEYGFKIEEKDIIEYIDDTDGELGIDELDLVSGGCGSKSQAREAGLVYKVAKWVKDLHVHCFTAESMVSTPSGFVSIKEIKAGDEVISLDESGNSRTGKVTYARGFKGEPTFNVTFENGKEWHTTESQWFYCGDGKWGCAGKENDKKAFMEDGTNAGIKSIEKTGKTEPVYDIIVEGLNVFFVNGVAAEGLSLS